MITYGIASTLIHYTQRNAFLVHGKSDGTRLHQPPLICPGTNRKFGCFQEQKENC